MSRLLLPSPSNFRKQPEKNRREIEREKERKKANTWRERARMPVNFATVAARFYESRESRINVGP